MPDIELIYDDDCPNVPAARQALRQACERVGRPARWQEWERSAAGAPTRVQAFGSPTVLVDGRDAAGPGSPGDARSCRVYRDADGRLQGAPPVALLVAALGGEGGGKDGDDEGGESDRGPRQDHPGGAGSPAGGWLAAGGAVLAGAGTLLLLAAAGLTGGGRNRSAAACGPA